jgi:hypothetical protein
MRIPLRKSLPILAVLALVAVASTAIAAKRTLSPNPADDPALISKKLDPNRYDGADGCRKNPTKGMRKLIRWMKRNSKRNTIYGTIRCDGGVHGTGRALDWMLDARRKQQRRKAMRMINTWLAEDKRGRRNALARRMGIQLIIYNCRWWQAGDRGWSRYSACSGGRQNADPTQGHIDHIHVELTKPASKLRTTYWKHETSGDEAGTSPTGGVGASAAADSEKDAHEHAHPPLHPPNNEAIETQLRR